MDNATMFSQFHILEYVNKTPFYEHIEVNLWQQFYPKLITLTYYTPDNLIQIVWILPLVIQEVLEILFKFLPVSIIYIIKTWYSSQITFPETGQNLVVAAMT
jgi:hypothetical protein